MKTIQRSTRWLGLALACGIHYLNACPLRRSTLRHALVVSCCALVTSIVMAQVPVIEPRNLGAELIEFLGTGVNSEAVAVNDLGQVVISVEKGQRGYLWSADSGFVDLGTLGGDTCGALAINNAGWVVGRSKTGGGDPHAFLWTPETGIQDLGTVTYPDSEAGLINGQGQMAGFATDPLAVGAMHAVWWGTGGVPMDIHDDALDEISRVEGLNNLGQVVGNAEPSSLFDFSSQAFRWDEAGGMQPLVAAAGYNWTWAKAVNDRGVVVGYTTYWDGDPTAIPLWHRACQWSPEGLPLILEQTETLISEAVDVNDAGQVVGYSEDTEDGRARATLWTPDATGMAQVALGTLGGAFPDSYAVAINELGQVAGYCTDSDPFGVIIKNPPVRTVAWTEPVGMVELDHLGTERSSVLALNNLGMAVGYSTTQCGLMRACVCQLPLPPLTPEEKVEAIVKKVIEMVDTGVLSHGDGTEFVVSLKGAADKLADGKATPAENKLGAFINKVKAKVNAGQLSPEDGAALIAAVSAVLEDLKD